MTPTAIYRCDQCGHQQSLDVGIVQASCCAFIGDGNCGGLMRRVWTPVAIGRVEGAGGSPARGSK